jgi:16S rRNA (guanine1207-N2)-methyltransferase
MTLRTVRARLLDKSFEFVTHPGLFSADAVDDGTLLLLDQLPEHAPRTVLDVGCGWGALGLPVAAAHPQASVGPPQSHPFRGPIVSLLLCSR